MRKKQMKKIRKESYDSIDPNLRQYTDTEKGQVVNCGLRVEYLKNKREFKKLNKLEK